MKRATNCSTIHIHRKHTRMHVVKFPWVKHAEGPRSFEIYSVSVSPDGSRLATGGLDGKVKLWSIDTLQKYKEMDKMKDGNSSSSNIRDKSECRPLCSMSRHAGAITCIRFCPNGRFLASGSDDKLVLIWEKDEEKTRIMAMHRNEIANSGDSNFLFANGDDSGINDADLEHWTVRKRLVAHDNDVQDMAWAPDGSILVTVGLDRSIVVWNGMTFEKIKRFDIHQSHVKGVVFDPAGKYFATCSDDRTMRIFRYRKGVSVEGADMEFVVENIIRDPFAKSPLTTYFRRCSWSPDGLYIAAPNGTNEGVNANVVIKRGNWDSELSLIGHRLPCEVCSFSPRLYDVEFGNNNRNAGHSQSSSRSETVIITAGQDRTLALWSSSCATPLCVATEISAKSITDVAWNPDGLNVFLCGLDGVVLSLFFDERELGHVVPWEENNRALIRYGKDRDMFFPESVEQLKLEEFAEKRGIIGDSKPIKPDRLQSLMGGSSLGGNTELNTSNNDESRKVMNVLIPRSKKHPNKRMPVPTITPRSTVATNNSNTNNIDVSASSQAKMNLLSSKTQNITITKSGKKRVAPTLISVSSTNAATSAPSKSNAFLSGTTATTTATADANTTTSKNLMVEKRSKLSKIISLPYPPLPKHGLSTLTSSFRPNVANDETEQESLEKTIDYIAETDNNNSSSLDKRGKFSSSSKKSSSSNTLSKYTNGGRKPNPSVYGDSSGVWNKRRKVAYPDWIKDSLVSPITIYGDASMSSYNVLVERKQLAEPLVGEQVVEVRYENDHVYKYLDHNDDTEMESNWNEFDAVSHILAKTTNCESDSLEKWELFLNERITCIGESSLEGLSYWCFGTENGRLLLVSTTGRQLCGSIELGSNIVKLVCNESFIMCVCANGLIYSWKFFKCHSSLISGNSIVEGVSLAPVLNAHSTTTESKKKVDISAKITNIYMRSNGCPIIAINDEKRNCIYSFDPLLESWVEVLDSLYVDFLPASMLDPEMKLLGETDQILKFMTKRFVKNKKYNDSRDIKDAKDINIANDSKTFKDLEVTKSTKDDTDTKDVKETQKVEADKIASMETSKGPALFIRSEAKEEATLQSIYEDWKSVNKCVAECINRKLEKC